MALAAAMIITSAPLLSDPSCQGETDESVMLLKLQQQSQEAPC